MSEESTTPDLVERVRVILEASTHRDWDTVLSFYAPDAVWDSAMVGMGTFEGHAAMRDLWEDFASVYQDWRVELEEARDLGNGVVFAMFRVEGRLAGSGGDVRERGVWVYEWVDDRIVRVVDYRERDIDHARAAAERLAEERGRGG